MRKIDIHFEIPQGTIFDEERFEKEHPVLYKKYLRKPKDGDGLRISINGVYTLQKNKPNDNLLIMTKGNVGI